MTHRDPLSRLRPPQSATQSATRPLTRSVAPIRARLERLVARLARLGREIPEADCTDRAWARWCEGVSRLARAVASGERTLARRLAHTVRVAAKARMLADARMRAGLREALGGDAAMARWNARAQRLRARVMTGGFESDCARPMRPRAGGRASSEASSVEMAGHRFRLAPVPRAGCARVRRGYIGGGRVLGIGSGRAAPAPIPVWPVELKGPPERRRGTATPRRRPVPHRTNAVAADRMSTGRACVRRGCVGTHGQRRSPALYAAHGRDP